MFAFEVYSAGGTSLAAIRTYPPFVFPTLDTTDAEITVPSAENPKLLIIIFQSKHCTVPPGE